MTADARTLETHQRAVLALLKDRPHAGRGRADEPPSPTAGEAYFERVRASRGLAMLRTITTWWRRYDLERQAPLTSRLLEHTGRFEHELSRLGQDPATPTSVDALGRYFLERLIDDADPLLAAVAGTERALQLLAHGGRAQHAIDWDRAPGPILGALLAGEAPGASAPGRYRVIVSSELPAMITVERLADPSPKGEPNGHV